MCAIPTNTSVIRLCSHDMAAVWELSLGCNSQSGLARELAVIYTQRLSKFVLFSFIAQEHTAGTLSVLRQLLHCLCRFCNISVEDNIVRLCIMADALHLVRSGIRGTLVCFPGWDLYPHMHTLSRTRHLRALSGKWVLWFITATVGLLELINIIASVRGLWL